MKQRLFSHEQLVCQLLWFTLDRCIASVFLSNFSVNRPKALCKVTAANSCTSVHYEYMDGIRLRMLSILWALIDVTRNCASLGN